MVMMVVRAEPTLLRRTSSTTRDNASCRPATGYAMRHAAPGSRRPHAHDALSGHGVRRVARDGSPNQRWLSSRRSRTALPPLVSVLGQNCRNYAARSIVIGVSDLPGND